MMKDITIILIVSGKNTKAQGCGITCLGTHKANSMAGGACLLKPTGFASFQGENLSSYKI